MKTLSLNLGLLGHVDCGKTSLAKCLSEISSTACFDKNPQSQERGITIDLGFSSFSLEASESIKKFGYSEIQYTLVDCPGHASLIKTIIGGAQIIDQILLVIDITKGIQTQTAECLVIAEIMDKPVLIVMNKVDLLQEENRQAIMYKMEKKVKRTLHCTKFKDTPIIYVSTKVEENSLQKSFGVDNLLKIIKENSFVPVRYPKRPMILSIDHCFLIKGKGTIMTGTVLQGSLKVHDDLEIPFLKMLKKVKSIQKFKKDVTEAGPGDRIGVCVTQFNPKLMERGVACTPNAVPTLYGSIIKLNKIRYFKSIISSKHKYHVSIGHETVMAKITLFSYDLVDCTTFSFENEYIFEETYDEEKNAKITFVLIEFERSIVAPLKSLLVCSKFDIDIQSTSCRLAFYGTSIYDICDSNYCNTLLPKLLIYKIKHKVGNIDRICNDNEVIVNSLFKKQNKMGQQYINKKIKLTSGESGVILSSFGQGGKIRIGIPEGLKSETIEQVKFNIKKSDISQPVKVILKFRQHIYSKEKNIIQDS